MSSRSATARRRAPDGIALLLWTTLPLLAYLTVHAVQEPVQGNWLAPIFPTLALAAAAAAGRAGPRWAPLASLVLPLGIASMAVGFVAMLNPGSVIPPQLDAGQVIRGWDGFSAEVDQLRKRSAADWVATTYYGIYGELSYHLTPLGVPVVAVYERVRYAYAPPPDPALLGKPLLIVTRQGANLTQCFTNLTSLGTIHRQVGTTIYQAYDVYRADGAEPRAITIGCDRG